MRHCKFVFNNDPGMQKLKKKSKVVFALEMVLYFIIAITVALAIIL
jgi:hypothetical protein